MSWIDNEPHDLAAIFRAYGCLYGPDHERTEALAIREACEALGVPMGFGRVARRPHVLSPDDLPRVRRG